MKKILILEGQSKIDDDSQIKIWIKEQEKEGAEIQYLFNVYNVEPFEIAKAMRRCDTLAFSTTFYYQDSIKGLGQILAATTNPITVVIDGYETEKSMRGILDEELAYIAAVGSEWSVLKKGDIVDEIDNSEMDPKPDRGIWVWGKTEPVKLLNEHPYNEYKLLTLSLAEASTEICKIIAIVPTTITLLAIAGAINLDEDLSVTEVANLICEVMEVPKRGNRARIEGLLVESKLKAV
jgi:hypothetical protein